MVVGWATFNLGGCDLTYGKSCLLSKRLSQEKKIIKNDTFLPSEANFEDFFKIPKIRNLKRIASQLLRVSQSLHKSYLLLKSHF